MGKSIIVFTDLNESSGKEEIFNWIDGLCIPNDCDAARINAGVRKVSMKHLRGYLHSLDRTVALGLFTEYIRERLSLDMGYDIKDVAGFLEWLKIEMEIVCAVKG